MKIHCHYDELIPLDQLEKRQHPKNPNTHSAAQIAAIAAVLEGNGWRQSIVVSRRNGLMTRGHGRLEAAILLGYEAAPVEFQDYASEADEIADMIADNRLSELSEMDEGQLADVLKELQAVGHDIALAGFTPEEFAKLTEEDDPTESLKPIPAMELQAFEHYDYLIFMFRDIRDWLRILQLVGVTRVNYSISRKTQKIGIGRVLDGKRLLARFEDSARDHVAEPKSARDDAPADSRRNAGRARKRD